jgi:hypothetical protein
MSHQLEQMIIHLEGENAKLRDLVEKAFSAGLSSGHTRGTNLWADPCYTMDHYCNYKNLPISYSEWASQHPILQHNS